MSNPGQSDPGAQRQAYHVPVLLQECIEGLAIQAGGVYVDVTFGGGGHSEALYRQLTTGKLIAFDQDPDAEQNISRFPSDADRSFVFVPANFRHLSKYLKYHRITRVNGILADLGVSSHQFDVGERGFSTRHEGALDMRMDRQSEQTAATVVNTYDESDLVHLLSYYGDIKNARTLAGAIVRARQQAPITTTARLADIAGDLAPRGKRSRYLAQLFQAIRIAVNDELGALREMLTQAVDVLVPGGRLVVISYHSLEDRLVKNLINTGHLSGKVEKDFYGNLIRPMDPLKRKPITPSQEEIDRNPRARSAKLRIGIKR